MAHGVLHLLGFGDKSEEEASQMRLKEDEKIKLFHVEH
jgi:ssRNA-specific RNase YbeY (16S rRNA maturation enzyme)